MEERAAAFLNSEEREADQGRDLVVGNLEGMREEGLVQYVRGVKHETIARSVVAQEIDAAFAKTVFVEIGAGGVVAALARDLDNAAKATARIMNAALKGDSVK